MNSSRLQRGGSQDIHCCESKLALDKLRVENAKLQFMLKEAKDQARHQDEILKTEFALRESQIEEEFEARKQEDMINEKERIDEARSMFEMERVKLEA